MTNDPPSLGAREEGRRDRIEIVGLGRGQPGFPLVRLNGVDQLEARVLLDLHGPLPVRIGDRVYVEEDADIVFRD